MKQTHRFAHGQLGPLGALAPANSIPALATVPPPVLTPVSWKSAVSGDWSTAALWTIGAVPGAGSSVSIAVAGTYTVTVASDASAGAITESDAGATLSVGADLTLGGTLAVTAGTLSLSQSGTITGGTLLADAGGTLILDTGGTLDDVDVQGTLTLATYGGSLTLGQGLAAGSAATIDVTGPDENLIFADTATLNGTTITLDPTQYQSFIDLVDTSSAAQTFTIGATSAISDIAGVAFLDGDTFSENLANLTIANDGTLSASGTTASLGIGSEAGAFINAGFISVTGGASLLLEPTKVTNTGTIAVTGAGSTLYLDYGVEINGTPTWTNTGDIDVSAGGTALLFGTGSLASLLSISNQGGTVTIEGTVTGPGTLTLPAETSGSLLLSGTIADATMIDPDGTTTFYQDGAQLEDDRYWGTLNIGNTDISIANVSFAGASGTGRGAIVAAGPDATLNLEDGSLNNAVLTLAGNLNLAFAVEPETITLGPNFEILDAGGANINNDGGGCTLDNEGTILAGDSGGRVTVSEYEESPGPATSFLVNSGKMEATNGDKLEVWGENFGDSFTNAGLVSASGGGTINLVQNTVVNSGTVTATGDGTMVTFGTQQTNQGTVAASWTNSGTIGVSSGATMDLVGGVNNSGRMSLSGGTLSFLAKVANSGTISVNAGSATFGEALSGNGVVDVGTGGVVALDNAGQGHLDFVAAGAELQVTHADLLYGLVGGFAAQDSIDLLKTAANGLSYNANTLTVLEGTRTVAEIHFHGSYSSASFTLVSDGHHGTSIHFV